MADKQQLTREVPRKDQPRPLYETPTVVTYTEEEILDELGPARAGTPPNDGFF